MTAKRLVAALGVFLLAASVPAAVPAEAVKKHILWAVEGKAATVYLMGAIHLLAPGSYPLDDVMEEAYRRSGGVAFEADLTELNSPRHVGRLMSRGIYLDGRSLEDDISEDTMGMLVERARQLGVPMGEILVMKPWLCSLTIYLKSLENQGLDGNYGLDAHFYLRARLDGKEMVFLETADFQMNLMASLAEGDQEDLLRQTLLDEGFFAGGFDGLYQAWEEGNAEWIAEYIAGTMDGYPEMKELFLDSRNRSWIPPIEELLAGERDSLVVVGAGHLVGEGSVVDLLRRRGWDIRRL